MRILNIKYYCLLYIPLMAICSCHSASEKADTAGDAVTTVGTPVTVTTISSEPLVEYVDLNATATFLQKSYVKANVNGYIQAINAASESM